MTDLAGLGRLHSPDARDAKYLLQPKAAAKTVTSHYWVTRPALDQMDTPQCVGFSGYQWLTSFPISNKPTFSPAELYYEAQLQDEWPGQDYDGSSVRGLFKALKDMGYVSEYRWAFSVEAIVDHLLTTGPVVVGTDWHEGMFMADVAGYIDDIGGRTVGGHAYLLVGANRAKRSITGNRGAVRVLNSWGQSWEQNGRAWLSFDALEELLRNDGEACTATEIKVAR